MALRKRALHKLIDTGLAVVMPVINVAHLLAVPVATDNDEVAG